MRILRDLVASGECRVASRKTEIALGDTRVFCAKSAQMVEKEGDELLSVAQERNRMQEQWSAGGLVERGW